MSRRLKIVAVLVSLVLLLLVVAFVGWRLYTHRAFPKTEGTDEVTGLAEPVDIVRDEYGVPHIYAQSPHDLYFTQGYVHAQDRFWQMEFQRRTGAARLSEVFGEATLSTDRYLRSFGFSQLAAQAYELLDDETRLNVEAYTEGVNAYVADRKPSELGLEFALLGVQGVDVVVETWTPVDSLIWAEMLMFDQSDQLNTELRNIDILGAVGSEMAADLQPPYRADRPVIIPEFELAAASSSPTAAIDQATLAYLLELRSGLTDLDPLPQLLADLGFGVNGGSNSFAVHGSKTATGMPILANDPHMGVNMPSLWYEIGLHCVEKSAACIYDLRGFSLPGVPGILIGHNDRIAWGLTNAAFDAEDVFIERINPADPNQYEVNGQWVDMEIRREEISVRGWDEPDVLFVRKTRNGLIVTDGMVGAEPFGAVNDGVELFELAYAWTALDPVQSFRAVNLVNRAQNWDEFVDALQYFDAGKQNWLYADVAGNIGYIMPGKVPIRAGGDGTLPVPGWTDDYIWTGFIPYEEKPQIFNPEKGYIATANNPQVRAEDYPYLLNVYHDRGQRAQRIVDLIEADTDGLSVEEIMAIQTDNLSLSALEIIPYLANLSFEDPAETAARERLMNWDGQMRTESPEAALFNIFFTHLVADAFYDQLPEDRQLRGESYTSDILFNLLSQATSAWWDDINTTGVEDRDTILTRAFSDAYQEGVDMLGETIDDWRWGDLHTITFRNATLGSSGIGLIENIFNRGPFPAHGSESVVQKTCWSTISPYEVLCIPALRQVIDLGNLGDSMMVHSVGQSGHPMHRHYDDLIELWRNLEYHPSNWTREAAEAGDHDVLTLEPSP